MSFSFSVHVVDQTGREAAYIPLFTQEMQAALQIWGNYLVGVPNATMDVEVDIADLTASINGGTVLAQGGPDWMTYQQSVGGLAVYTPGTLSELHTGIDPNGASPDVTITYAAGALAQSWFDPNPLTRSGAVPANQYDVESILLHEFGHGLGFTGWRDDNTFALSSSYESTFDTYVSVSNGQPYFTGPRAEAVFGGPVPLTAGDLYHYGDGRTWPNGSFLTGLMSPVTYPGIRESPGALDLAILRDIGAPVVQTVNLPPVITGGDLQEARGGGAVALSSVVSYSDPDNDPAVFWYVQDVTSDPQGGAVIVNGNPLGTTAPVKLSAADFAAATIRPTSAAHEIWVVASDGIVNSAPIHFNVLPPADHPPVITVNDLIEVRGGSAVALSSQVGYSDPDNDPAAFWYVQDVTSDPQGGAILVNGTAVGTTHPARLSVAEFASATIRPTTAGHEIWVVASDGIANSAPGHFNVVAPAFHAPTIAASDLQETRGGSAASLSSVVSYTDSDGNPVAFWYVQDVITDPNGDPQGGAVLVNGAAVGTIHPVKLSAADFAAATIRPTNAAHEIWVVASNGGLTSAPIHFNVLPPVNHAPVIAAGNLQEVPGGGATALASVVSYSDLDNDPAVRWYVQDVVTAPGGDPQGGAVMVNGAAVGTVSPKILTPAEFATASIRPVSAGHEIWVVASDGIVNSAPIHFTVAPPPATTAYSSPVLAASPPVATTSADLLRQAMASFAGQASTAMIATVHRLDLAENLISAPHLHG